jgi:poly(3-hydroxybutyrate) depolymerase
MRFIDVKNFNDRCRLHWLALVGALLPLATWAQSAGCNTSAANSGPYTFRHGTVSRHYGLSLPANYDARRPTRLLLAFHSWGGDEREFLDEPSVVAEASRRGYILVAPRGLGSGAPDQSKNSWTFRGSATGVVGKGAKQTPVCDLSVTPDYRYPSCLRGTAVNQCSWTQCQDDDVAFVASLVAHLEATLCVDARHVYALGGFNGGMFIWELGENPHTASLFRAMASIIGLPHRGDLRSPAREPLPMLLITGLKDIEVPPGAWDDNRFTTSTDQEYTDPTRGTERIYYTGATAAIRRWARAAGCPSAGPERPFDTGHAEADCRSYCAAPARGWPAVLDCRSPMGHDYGFDWSFKLVLDFFDRV